MNSAINSRYACYAHTFQPSLGPDSLLAQAANTKLNQSIIETAFYKKVLGFALDEGLPDKKAAAYALKMTLDYFKASE